MAGYRQRQELIFYTQPRTSLSGARLQARGTPSMTHVTRMKIKDTTAMGCVRDLPDDAHDPEYLPGAGKVSVASCSASIAKKEPGRVS